MGTEASAMELNKIVKLNVGGTRYSSSLATLTVVENSYFSALFSGKWRLCRHAYVKWLLYNRIGLCVPLEPARPQEHCCSTVLWWAHLGMSVSFRPLAATSYRGRGSLSGQRWRRKSLGQAVGGRRLFLTPVGIGALAPLYCIHCPNPSQQRQVLAACQRSRPPVAGLRLSSTSMMSCVTGLPEYFLHSCMHFSRLLQAVQ